MPRIVDWDARRDEVLNATWRVIAREGLGKTTIRQIAQEAGYSSGVLAHYFTDKQDILTSSLMLCHNRVRERIARRTRGLEGLEALRVLMEEALPLDDQRDLEAGIEMSFWHQALGNPTLARLQHDEFDLLCDELRSLLLEASRLHQLRSGLDIEEAVHTLMVLIDGLSAERVLFPSRVSPGWQLALLDSVLAGFSTASGDGDWRAEPRTI